MSHSAVLGSPRNLLRLTIGPFSVSLPFSSQDSVTEGTYSLESDRPELKFQVGHLLAIQPGAHYLPSLSPGSSSLRIWVTVSLRIIYPNGQAQPKTCTLVSLLSILPPQPDLPPQPETERRADLPLSSAHTSCTVSKNQSPPSIEKTTHGEVAWTAGGRAAQTSLCCQHRTTQHETLVKKE